MRYIQNIFKKKTRSTKRILPVANAAPRRLCVSAWRAMFSPEANSSIHMGVVCRRPSSENYIKGATSCGGTDYTYSYAYSRAASFDTKHDSYYTTSYVYTAVHVYLLGIRYSYHDCDDLLQLSTAVVLGLVFVHRIDKKVKNRRDMHKHAVVTEKINALPVSARPVSARLG